MGSPPYLKRLEIKGFKSFAERTVVEFVPGINVIVGPNGCGKSNLVDAIHWVFGTHSARDLRGTGHDDLIFNGSERRAPLGFAEVRAILSGEEGFPHTPFAGLSEVEVYRRWNRGEHSEYRLNQVRVRLKDILDFLYALGWGSYSIIHQDAIQEISLATPEALRRFLEESSGVSRFYMRRQEAQKRIEDTLKNLQELTRILTGIEERHALLKIQAETAQRVLGLKEQEKRYALILFFKDKERHMKELQGAEKEQERLGKALEEKRGELEKVYEELKLLAKEEEEETRRRSELQKRQEELQGVFLQSKEQEAECSREQEIGKEEAQRLKEQLQRSVEEEHLLVENLEESRRRVEESESRWQRVEEEGAQLEQSRRERLKEEEVLQGRRRTLQEELIEVLKEEAESRSALETCEYRIRELTQKKHEREERLQGLGSERERLQNEEEQLSRRRKEEEKGLQALLIKLEEHQRSLEELEGRLKGIRVSLAALEEEKERFKLLKVQLRQSFQELSPLPDEEGYLFPWKGVRFPQGETAFWETMLGARLRALFPRAPGAVQALLERFQKGELKERITILCALEEPNPSPPSPYIPVWERLEILPGYEWVRSLLKGLYLSPQPLDPLHPPRDLPPDLEELWDEQGVVYLPGIGFSLGPLLSTGIVHLHRKEEELLRAEEKCRRKEEELRRALSQGEQEQERLNEELRLLKEERVKQEKSLEALRLELERVLESRKRLEEDEELTRRELEELEGEEEELQEEMAQGESRLKELSQERARKEKEFQEVSKKIEEERQLWESLQSRYTRLMEERERLLKERTSLTQELREKELKLKALLMERRRAEERLQFWEERLKELEEKRNELVGKRRHLEEELSAIQRELKVLEEHALSRHSRRRSLEEKLLYKQRELEGLGSQKARLEQRLSDLREKLALAEQVFVEMYGEKPQEIEIPDHLSRQRLEEELARIRREIQEVGAVNYQAIEELKAVEAERDRLAREKADLEEALRRSQEFLKEMDAEARTRFLSYLDAVRTQFYTIFEELSGGGRGELRLTEPEDWIKSGVEIVVQFPGARRSRMELLSGGQKALTSLALLCALFLCHPGPCLVLDEVDAPLDEVNLKRFHELLGRLVTRTQVIIVTHHPLTMEIAQRIIGVTQRERGVSTLIPYHLA